jgi:hypothetical protein
VLHEISLADSKGYFKSIRIARIVKLTVDLRDMLQEFEILDVFIRELNKDSERKQDRMGELILGFFYRIFFKIVNYVQGQGVDSVLKRSVHAVREHLKTNRNAAIGRKMQF